MELPVARQAVEFARAAALGLALGCWYDVLRALRRRHPRLTVPADGLYCLTALLALLAFALYAGADDAAVRTAWHGSRGNALVSDAQPAGAAPVQRVLGAFREAPAPDLRPGARNSENFSDFFQKGLCNGSKMG